jgi:uncharacterized protein YggE
MRQLIYSLACSSWFLVSGTSFATDESNNGITATGTCIKKVSQDRASVALLSTSLAANATEASREATKAHNKLRDAIQNLKLENMQLDTLGYNVSEEREWLNKKSVSKGYRANIALQVETSDIARIGDVIAVATKQGVKGVDQLNTFVSNEKYKSEYEGCLETAARNAKDKAAKLAKGAGIKLGKVLVINEGRPPSNTISYRRGEVMAQARAFAESDNSAEPAPVTDAKPIDMTVSATVTFSPE